jgi:hypothetical protein
MDTKLNWPSFELLAKVWDFLKGMAKLKLQFLQQIKVFRIKDTTCSDLS